MTTAGIPFCSVRDEQDHTAAIKRIEALIGAVPGSVEGDELDLLATLVEAYEAKHHPVDVLVGDGRAKARARSR